MKLRVLATLIVTVWRATAADTILLDGKIVTLDALERVVEALAVRDGRILATGTSAEIEKLATPATEVIRLAGKTERLAAAQLRPLLRRETGDQSGQCTVIR